MTEFLVVIGLVDLLVLVALFAVMRAGRAHDRASEAHARSLWASQQRQRTATPVEPASSPGTGVAGHRVLDSHGTRLGVAGEFIHDRTDGRPQWLEVHVRGIGASRLVLVPANGLAVSMTEVRVPAPREHVLRAPYPGASPLTRETELTLCRHYGASRRSAELSSVPAGSVTAAVSEPTQAVSVA